MSELINNREKRVQTLKEVILHLHRGEAPDAVRGRLAALISEVDAGEVAAMEQQLMSEGMSHQEVQALCDLHADVLKDVMTRPETPMPLAPGHPVHQLRAVTWGIVVQGLGLTPETSTSWFDASSRADCRARSALPA
jgi:uncharacterized protein